MSEIASYLYIGIPGSYIGSLNPNKMKHTCICIKRTKNPICWYALLHPSFHLDCASVLSWMHAIGLELSALSYTPITTEYFRIAILNPRQQLLASNVKKYTDSREDCVAVVLAAMGRYTWVLEFYLHIWQQNGSQIRIAFQIHSCYHVNWTKNMILFITGGKAMSQKCDNYESSWHHQVHTKISKKGGGIFQKFWIWYVGWPHFLGSPGLLCM